ncbi:exosortase-associated EpsI family protein [Tautonia sp. JC769]|uniref:exosortase-associated EpsI family protein n=1 Tax=Tautonia sp. JC769 TaxID=3232135 RepID=UPI0034577C6C
MPDQPQLDQSAPVARRPLGSSPWIWMIVGCALVAASGVVRLRQEQLFADASLSVKQSPFPLRSLPTVLGGHWEMIQEEELEAETQQIAGCSDYMYRFYANTHTGVTLKVLVAFGPATQVFPHAPDVCFPSQGFQLSGNARRVNVPVESAQAASPDDPGGSTIVPFRAMTFSRPNAEREELIESHYSFWHDGRWDPDAKETRRKFQHRPAMFKVQVDRTTSLREQEASQSASEEFVAALIAELNHRIDEWIDHSNPRVSE